MSDTFTLADAKRLMRKLMDLGNFDEFRDVREKDGLNGAAAFEIRDFVLDCIYRAAYGQAAPRRRRKSAR